MATRKLSPPVMKNSPRSCSRAMIDRRLRDAAMPGRHVIGGQRIEDRAMVSGIVVSGIVVSGIVVSGGRAMAIGILAIEALATVIASRTIAGRAMVTAVVGIDVVPRIVGRVRGGRKIVARRLYVGMVVADLVGLAVSVGRCRDSRQAEEPG
jgi:hypothetical protein